MRETKFGKNIEIKDLFLSHSKQSSSKFRTEGKEKNIKEKTPIFPKKEIKDRIGNEKLPKIGKRGDFGMKPPRKDFEVFGMKLHIRDFKDFEMKPLRKDFKDFGIKPYSKNFNFDTKPPKKDFKNFGMKPLRKDFKDFGIIWNNQEKIKIEINISLIIK